MTLREVVSLFGGKGRGTKYRAKCPVHKSRGLTLAISEGQEWIHVHCFAGCDIRDILAAVGIQLKDLARNPRVKMTAREMQELTRKRQEDERRAKAVRKTQMDAVNATRLWEATANDLLTKLIVTDDAKLAEMWRFAQDKARTCNTLSGSLGEVEYYRSGRRSAIDRGVTRMLVGNATYNALLEAK